MVQLPCARVLGMRTTAVEIDEELLKQAEKALPPMGWAGPSRPAICSGEWGYGAYCGGMDSSSIWRASYWKIKIC